MYHKFTDVLDIPVLANMTEFGQTDLYTTAQIFIARLKAADLLFAERTTIDNWRKQ